MFFRTILPKLETSSNGNYDQYYGLTRNYFLYLAGTSPDTFAFRQALHSEGTRKYKRKGERLYKKPSIVVLDEEANTFRIDYEQVLLPPSATSRQVRFPFGIIMWVYEPVSERWSNGRYHKTNDFHIDEICDNHLKAYKEKAWRACGGRDIFENIVNNGLVKFI
jgi:hypothetical protein